MRAADVIEVLTLLDESGAQAWVDGGWGVDALLREVGREHSDLDLVIFVHEVGLVRSVLAGAGF